MQDYQRIADRLNYSYEELGCQIPTTPGAGSRTAMVDETTVRKLTLGIGFILRL